MAIALRPYQVAAIKAFYESVRQGQRSIMLCAPTGAGKTLTALALFEHLTEHGKSANFVVDRTVLLQQTSDVFVQFKIPHGVVSGGETWGRREKLQIVSAQSARSRGIDLTQADLTVVDEAHVIHNYVARQIMDGGRWLGLSASPFRAGLADLYQGVVNVETTDKLVEQGWLAPLKFYCGVTVEPGKRTSVGEYDPKETGENALAVVGDLVKEWEEKTREHFGAGVKTIVFANTVTDAEGIAERFQAAGHDFRALSYQTPDGEKTDMIDALRRGRIMGLVSCEMLQRGFDVPDIMCGIDAHPWRKSLSAVVQQAGRAMRPAPGKEFALWLDAACNILRFRDRLFGFWGQGCNELIPRDNVAGPDNPDREDAVCPACTAILFGPRCRECGWEKPEPLRSEGPGESGTICIDGKLVPLEPGDPREHVVRVGKKDYEIPPPARGWLELCALAKESGKGPEQAQRWCQANFHKMYGRFARNRFDPGQHYPSASDAVFFAVQHSIKLWLDARTPGRRVVRPRGRAARRCLGGRVRERAAGRDRRGRPGRDPRLRRARLHQQHRDPCPARRREEPPPAGRQAGALRVVRTRQPGADDHLLRPDARDPRDRGGRPRRAGGLSAGVMVEGRRGGRPSTFCPVRPSATPTTMRCGAPRRP